LRSEQFQSASEKFRAALAIDPHLGEAEIGLASALHDLGCIEEAIEAGRRALLLRPQDTEAHSRLLFALLHSAETGPRQVFEEHANGREGMPRVFLPVAPSTQTLASRSAACA